MMSAQEVEYSSSGGTGGLITSIIYLLFMVLFVAGLWKTFVKAGEPGWAAIVPIYNVITILKLGGKPWYWAIVPIVGPIMLIIAEIELAKRFGKGTGFGIGLAFLPFIFFPMLGFGGASVSGGVPAPAR